MDELTERAKLLIEIRDLLPIRYKHKHAREFFQGEGQEIDDAYTDGMNTFRDTVIDILSTLYRKEQITNDSN